MASEDARKLFVAGLPESIAEDALRQIFEATGGKVTDVSLPRDRATGRIRGFGFVTFSTSEEAATARGSLDGSLQAGRPISVRPFSSEPPRRDGPRPEGGGFGGGSIPPGNSFSGPPPASVGGGAGGGGDDRTLYVGNLPYDVNQPELTQLFTDHGIGPVVRIHLPMGPDGRPRGFGFITLATADAANAAVGVLKELDVRGRRLMVNIAHPRGERPPGAPGPRPYEGGGGGGPGAGAGAGAGGGWQSEPRPSFAPESPADPSLRPVDPRRARSFGPPSPPGGGGADWAEADRKKKKKGGAGTGGGRPAAGRRERGGGGRQWDDPDDE